MANFFGLFDSAASMESEFSGTRYTDEHHAILGFPKDSEVLFASYEYRDYSGNAFVLYERDGKLYEVNGSHCSCTGLENQWEPEETTWEALKIRQFSDYEVGDQLDTLRALIDSHAGLNRVDKIVDDAMKSVETGKESKTAAESQLAKERVALNKIAVEAYESLQRPLARHGREILVYRGVDDVDGSSDLVSVNVYRVDYKNVNDYEFIFEVTGGNLNNVQYRWNGRKGKPVVRDLFQSAKAATVEDLADLVMHSYSVARITA